MPALAPEARSFVYRTILRPLLRSFTSTTAHTAPSSSSKTTSTQAPPPEPTPTPMASPTASPLPHITPTPLTRPALHRLHALSALRPPPPDSDEERVLMRELGELMGLMELVKSVELPEGALDEEGGVGVEGLLAEGVGAVVIGRPGEGEGASDGEGQGVKRETEGKHGHELLGWSPTRTGDFYSSALPPPRST